MKARRTTHQGDLICTRCTRGCNDVGGEGTSEAREIVNDSAQLYRYGAIAGEKSPRNRSASGLPLRPFAVPGMAETVVFGNLLVQAPFLSGLDSDRTLEHPEFFGAANNHAD